MHASSKVTAATVPPRMPIPGNEEMMDEITETHISVHESNAYVFYQIAMRKQGICTHCEIPCKVRPNKVRLNHKVGAMTQLNSIFASYLCRSRHRIVTKVSSSIAVLGGRCICRSIDATIV